MLQSLIDHTSPEWNYDLIILQSQLSDQSRQQLAALAHGRPHISLRFYDVTEHLKGKDFRCSATYSLATWYRLFAPSIFAAYDRIIYLDADLTLLADVAELYHEETGENWLAGCTDLGIVGDSARQCSRSYFLNTIGVADIMQYVNAGVLLFNLRQMREHNVEQSCVEAALTHRFWCHDQDTLNYVCRGHIHLLDQAWNTFPARGFEQHLTPEQHLLWEHKKAAPRIIHYVGEKPWVNPLSDMACHWWQAAAHTPFYDEVRRAELLSLLGHVAHYPRDLWRYRVCRTLSHITFGKLRRKLKEQKRKLRTRLHLIRSILANV